MKNSQTIVLTSSGFKEQAVADAIIKRLPKKPAETKLAHIFTASNVAPDTEYVKRDLAALNKLGFQVADLTLERKTETELYETLKEFDIIYVQGGNGFYLLRHIKESGFDRVIKKLLDEGKWYIGVSAGTYVCCPTIEMHDWKRVRNERFGLTDISAMNLVPFLVTVHYNRDKYREKLATNIPNATAPVRILTDEQALLIQDGKVELIGEGEEITANEIVEESMNEGQTWYVTHGSGFDYQSELYKPLKESKLWSKHKIILPHDEGAEVKNSNDWIEQADTILAEVSHPSTGQGIELGWANRSGKKIVGFYKQGSKPSGSLKFVTSKMFEYQDAESLIKNLEEL